MCNFYKNVCCRTSRNLETSCQSKEEMVTQPDALQVFCSEKDKRLVWEILRTFPDLMCILDCILLWCCPPPPPWWAEGQVPGHLRAARVVCSLTHTHTRVHTCTYTHAQAHTHTHKCELILPPLFSNGSCSKQPVTLETQT